MAFNPALTRVPVRIRALYVALRDFADIGEVEAHQEAKYTVLIEYNDGSVEAVSGDLVPHITAAQIEALQGFLAGLRVQAEQQILPQEG